MSASVGKKESDSDADLHRRYKGAATHEQPDNALGASMCRKSRTPSLIRVGVSRLGRLYAPHHHKLSLRQRGAGAGSESLGQYTASGE